MNIRSISFNYPKSSFSRALTNSVSMKGNNDSGFTPEKVEKFINCGGNVNTFGPHGYTPLRDMALMYNRLDICDKLLQCGANPYNQGKDGLTDLDAVLMYSKSTFVKDMVQSAAKFTNPHKAIKYSDKF